MRNAKPQCFHVSGKNFAGNEKFPGNIYLKPEISPVDRGFCIVNNVMSPYDLYEIFSGFSFLVSKFSNLSIISVKMCLIRLQSNVDPPITSCETRRLWLEFVRLQVKLYRSTSSR